MIDKPCQPDHEMVRDIVERLHYEGFMETGDYSILCDYINDCQCLLDPALGDCK